jgi:N-acetylglucosamine-6-phosphate deacetylase
VKTVLLKNGFVVTPQGIVHTDIIMHNDKIELNADIKQYDEVVDITGKYVVPGCVDIHFHGYALFDFTVGLYNPKTDTFDNSPEVYERCFDMLSKKLAEFGVTGFYFATFAASLKTLKRCYGQLADYMSRANDTISGARLLGGMLEGTFINPNMAGAMNPDLVFEPAQEVFDRIEDRGAIKLANVVPDWGAKSCALTEYLTNKGVIVGMGHTAKAGLKYCMHFTNGPTGSSCKPFNGGGATEAVLKFDELYAEQICDGFHVNPAYVRDIIKRKGIDKILGITDCMFVAGSDLKEFTAGGVRGVVSENGNYLRVVDKTNTLFGSNLTKNTGFANVLNWLTTDMEGIWNRLHPAMELEKALVATAKMLSTNQAILTGRDKQGYGSIANGAKADLCVLDITGSEGNYDVTVEATIVDGNTVYDKNQK